MIDSDKNLPLFPGLDLKEPDPLVYESAAIRNGYRIIAGVDEAGRGPLAGPVVAAAVIIPEGIRLQGVKDSKKMTEKARKKAFSIISHTAVSIGIGVVSHQYIDEKNILRASLEAMRLAVSYLEPPPEFVLIDGIHGINASFPQKCIIKGDMLSQSISASSIIAKVYRDSLMDSFHEKYPEYGFNRNRGYGTARHLEALRKYGPCPVHRLTFRGVN